MNQARRGRPPFTAEYKRYIGHRALFEELLFQHNRLKINIAEFGIGKFGNYSKNNKRALAYSASVLIGMGC